MQAEEGFRTSIVVAFCDADVPGCRRAAVGAAGASSGSSCLFFVKTLHAWKFIKIDEQAPKIPSLLLVLVGFLRGN